MSKPDILVDARGLRCPWPVLRLSRAVREVGSGDIHLLIDESESLTEVIQLCSERGWQMRDVPGEAGEYRILIP